MYIIGRKPRPGARKATLGCKLRQPGEEALFSEDPRPGSLAPDNVDQPPSDDEDDAQAGSLIDDVPLSAWVKMDA